MKGGVDKLAPSACIVTQIAGYPSDITINAPIVNYKCDAFRVLYYIMNFVIHTNIQLRQIHFDVFLMYFTIIQLHCHINAVVITITSKQT